MTPTVIRHRDFRNAIAMVTTYVDPIYGHSSVFQVYTKDDNGELGYLLVSEPFGEERAVVAYDKWVAGVYA